MPKRRASDDDAWTELHAGDCALGSISELRSADPPGRPYEPIRGPLGFLEYAGNTLKRPQRAREKRRRKKG